MLKPYPKPSIKNPPPQATPQVRELLGALQGEMGRKALQSALGLSDRKSFRERYLKPALNDGLIEMTIPEKPNSPLQKYYRTKKGDAAVRLYGSMAAAALLVFVFPVFQLNKWATTRGEQMDAIAKSAQEMGGVKSRASIPEKAEAVIPVQDDGSTIQLADHGFDSDAHPESMESKRKSRNK